MLEFLGMIFGFLCPKQVGGARCVAWDWRFKRAAWTHFSSLAQVTPDQLKAICIPRRLRALTSPLTPAMLALLAPFTGLKQLVLSDCFDLNSADLESIVALQSLEELTLKKCSANITDDALRHVAALQSLNLLDLKGNFCITSAGLAHLAVLGRLETLNLSASKITDDVLAPLSSLKSLKQLHLVCCLWLSHAATAHIANCANLELLNMYIVVLTDASLECLPRSLHTLIISSSLLVTNKGLLSIAELRNLRKLCLSFCRNITDDGLAHLVRLPALEDLTLDSCCEITDAGMVHVAALPLRVLDISYCTKVTDAGILHLAGVRSLQHLNVRGCKSITTTALSTLPAHAVVCS